MVVLVGGCTLSSTSLVTTYERLIVLLYPSTQLQLSSAAFGYLFKKTTNKPDWQVTR
jgi:hypothetical protein